MGQLVERSGVVFSLATELLTQREDNLVQEGRVVCTALMFMLDDYTGTGRIISDHVLGFFNRVKITKDFLEKLSRGR